MVAFSTIKAAAILVRSKTRREGIMNTKTVNEGIEELSDEFLDEVSGGAMRPGGGIGATILRDVEEVIKVLESIFEPRKALQ